MDQQIVKAYQSRLNERLVELSQTDTTEARATVVLDQTSVGRLSRMDAMQQQAMANATHQRRMQQITRIKLALKRIDEDEFGYCADCGDEIPAARLDLDPTVPRCITCTRG